MVKTVIQRAAIVSIFCTLLVGLQPIQAQTAQQELEFRVTKPSHKLEMVVNSSRILTLDKEIPRAMVNNPNIVRVVPISPIRFSSLPHNRA